MTPLHWQPTANIATLKLRAVLLHKIRAFFAQREVWEVETPLLCHTAVTDPFLEAMSLDYRNQRYYLQTSPEYAMKRLLCAGSGSLYQISKAFRCDEKGTWHHPEFTMLEWYRTGFTHHDLMHEMDDFLQAVIETPPAQKLSYQAVFERYIEVNPHRASQEDLKSALEKNNISVVLDSGLRENNERGRDDGLDRDDYLHLLMTHIIEPRLDRTHPVFIYDFPVSQAALAKIRHDDFPVAERFEVYLNGIELANGYHELTNAEEQKNRFEKDLQKRKALGYPAVPIDHYLLSALAAGLPACAGVALGLDRLVMIAAHKASLAEVMAFTHDCI